MASIIINSLPIKEVYERLSTIEYILLKDFKHVNSNKSYLDNLVISDVRGVYSKKMDTALKFIDDVYLTFYESAVVVLIATFEGVAFDKYKNTYGYLKTIVKENSEKPLSYYSAREGLVNSGIDKISAIIQLVNGHISQDLHNKLTIIKDYRDHIAHGKRFSSPPSTRYEISEIAKILDDVILAIEN